MEFAKRKLFETESLGNTEAQPARKLEQYQKNMKLFIVAVEKQISVIIAKYQREIQELQQKNEQLKKQLAQKEPHKQNLTFNPEFEEPISPVKRRAKFPDVFDTAHSNFFSTLKSPFESDAFLQNSCSPTKKFHYRPEDKGSDFMYRSRFEAQSSEKKQRQQYLLQSLEMGKSNLDENTSRMFGLLGKTKKVQNDDAVNCAEEVGTNKKKAKFVQSSLNTSLSSLCDSLNNSFHAKKAQERTNRKKKQQKTQNDSKKKQEEQQQKIRKEQGVKNLLNSMRKNIAEGPQRQETIKASKLLVTGSKSEMKNKSQSQKPKVMINPIPVDALKRNQHKDILESPTRTPPPSILKKSSKNILTRSISNISAISFHSSGGEE